MEQQAELLCNGQLTPFALPSPTSPESPFEFTFRPLDNRSNATNDAIVFGAAERLVNIQTDWTVRSWLQA